MDSSFAFVFPEIVIEIDLKRYGSIQFEKQIFIHVQLSLPVFPVKKDIRHGIVLQSFLVAEIGNLFRLSTKSIAESFF